jgi:ribonuclease PH
VLAFEKLRLQAAISRIPVTDYVAATSVGVVDGTPLLDLAYDEDSRAEVDMNIVKTSDGRFIELQGTAETKPFDRAGLDALLALGDIGIRHLIERQRAVVGKILKY